MPEILSKKSCVDFAGLLASRAAVPGGGGSAALTGALAAALGEMSTRLTLGKKKFLPFEADHQRLIRDCTRIRERFLALIEEDAAAFEPLARAYSMDKNAPGYAETMRSATLTAARSPLKMMACCAELIPLVEEMQEKCSKLLLSDVGCAAVTVKAAMEAASMNVFVNTRLLPEDREAQRMCGEAAALRAEFLPRAEAVADGVMAYLRG